MTIRTVPAFVVLAVSIQPFGAAAQQPVSAEVVAGGFDRPVEFVRHPTRPGVQFIVEQGGKVFALVDGAVQAEPVIDLAPLIFVGHPEHGLVAMAIDPADDGAMYLQYTRPPAGASRVERFVFTSEDPWAAALSPRAQIIDRPQPSAIHNGNAMRFGPEGLLHISYGDGGPVSDPNDQGQNLGSLYGAIARIDPDPSGGYTVPKDNPFVGAPGAAPEIFHYGLRNVWKFSFDTGPCSTGGILMGDVGNFAVEEVNFALPEQAGANFGWDCFEGTVPFDACGGGRGGFTDPVYEYDRGSGLGTSVTGGYVYRGRSMPHNRGRAVFADFISGRVMSFALSVESGEPVAAGFIDHTMEITGEPGTTLGNVSAFGRDADGELYVLDYSGGTVRRLIPATPPADLTQDGAVGSDDLGRVLAAWGSGGCAPEDLDNDGVVGSSDLGALLAAWGQ